MRLSMGRCSLTRLPHLVEGKPHFIRIEDHAKDAKQQDGHSDDSQLVFCDPVHCGVCIGVLADDD